MARAADRTAVVAVHHGLAGRLPAMPGGTALMSEQVAQQIHLADRPGPLPNPFHHQGAGVLCCSQPQRGVIVDLCVAQVADIVSGSAGLTITRHRRPGAGLAAPVRGNRAHHPDALGPTPNSASLILRGPGSRYRAPRPAAVTLRGQMRPGERAHSAHSARLSGQLRGRPARYRIGNMHGGEVGATSGSTSNSPRMS